MESIVFSLNVVVPIFLIILTGWLLMRLGLVNQSFSDVAQKLVFTVCLPATLFLEILDTDLSAMTDLRFIGFCAIGMVVQFLLLLITVPLFIRNKASVSAFIQGAFRANFAILGIPLIENLVGSDGLGSLTVILPYTIVFYNLFAVIIMTVYDPTSKKVSVKKTILDCILSILKNPQIIATLLGILLLLIRVPVPHIVTKSVGYLGQIASPLALLCIGIDFTAEGLRSRLGLSVWSSVLKIVIFPIIGFSLAVVCGFRGAQLGVILLLFGGPSSVTGYIMAKNMKSDYQLAGGVVLLTTIFSALTIFIGTYIMTRFSLL